MSKFFTFKERKIGKFNFAHINIEKITAIVESGAGSTIYLAGGQTIDVYEKAKEIREIIDVYEQEK